ncbi:hypothetical protein DMN91_006280 [Ooceraea biroi]|uniref:C3H1-type domain-containing protein n=1 Tax=Ooceraea biroi TaxID=2015173 RepID=A0A3L8DNV0_OOCBI|nr:zinc finger matrin-type protein 5 isoform X1 [Ooceraea biroi]RLU21902.1 hypothetical protein DMN91_006280 [Ooceraea biroi]
MAVSSKSSHWSVFEIIDFDWSLLTAYFRRPIKLNSHCRTRFNTFTDPETILKEEYEKTPCKRYMTIGDCAFGLGCRFSHYTPPMIWELERLVAAKNSKDLTTQPKDGWPNPEDIINEYFENEMDPSGAEKLDYPSMSSTPSRLADYPYLPRSLRPVTSEGMADSDFSKWG